MKRVALLVGALVLAAGPPAADPPPNTWEPLLAATSPADLRARLQRFAGAAQTSNPGAAGEAHFYIALSHERAGQRDSAIAHYRIARAQRGDLDDIGALSEAWLARRGPEDVSRAAALLRTALAGSEGPEARRGLASRLAWAEFLAGRADTAAVLLGPLAEGLVEAPRWRFRLAQVALATGDRRRAAGLLLPLALASRGQDHAVMEALRQAVEPDGGARGLDAQLERQSAAQDRREEARWEAMGARGVNFVADDGFPLGGAILPAADDARLGAVVLMGDRDTVAVYDSLAATLRRAGIATLFLEPRGSGRSVGPACPGPEAWSGREDALVARCARDARVAFSALARTMPVDTSRYLVAGVGSSATIAVMAATLDRRVVALMLASPSPSPVDYGPTRARLARLQLPAFFQISPEDFLDLFQLTEAFYQAGNRARSRVSEGRGAGRGAEQFRHDELIAGRFSRWLDDALKPTPRAPRPAPRRRG